MSHKLDIFETLRAIDTRDFEFLDRQEAETRKGFAPPVVLRWASTIQGREAEDHLLRINRVANRRFWDIWDHPDLQFRLMAVCGRGARRHDWLAMPGKARSSSKVVALIGRYWPDAREDELDLILSQFDRAGYEDFVQSRGLPPGEVAEAMADYDAYKGVKASARKKKSKGQPAE